VFLFINAQFRQVHANKQWCLNDTDFPVCPWGLKLLDAKSKRAQTDLTFPLIMKETPSENCAEIDHACGEGRSGIELPSGMG